MYDFRVRYTRVCVVEKGNRFRTILHDNSAIKYYAISLQIFKNVQTIISFPIYKIYQQNFNNITLFSSIRISVTINKFIFILSYFINLIKFHKLYIVHLCHNIFFINRAEEHLNFSNFHEYGRNKSRLVSALDHDSFLRNKISRRLSLSLGTHTGKGGIRANRSKVRHLNNLFLVLSLRPFPPLPSPPPLLLGAPVVAREGAAGRLARRNFNGAHSEPHGSSVL